MFGHCNVMLCNVFKKKRSIKKWIQNVKTYNLLPFATTLQFYIYVIFFYIATRSHRDASIFYWSHVQIWWTLTLKFVTVKCKPSSQAYVSALTHQMHTNERELIEKCNVLKHCRLQSFGVLRIQLFSVKRLLALQICSSANFVCMWMQKHKSFSSDDLGPVS